MADLNINDVTIGMSFTGTVEYIDRLNIEAIEKTKIKLAELDGIRSALEKGWVGQAEINFVANLQKSVGEVQSTLDILDKTLRSQFAQIAENMVEQDRNMVPLE